MSQVIIYSQANGQVAVCVPTGELSIQEVLAKDCPAGAIIVDSASLPQDNTYFNAWRIEGDIVVVDIDAARQVALNNLNAWAAQTATQRATNMAIGIQPGLNDAEFIDVLNQGRAALETATTTVEMSSIVAATEAQAGSQNAQ